MTNYIFKSLLLIAFFCSCNTAEKSNYSNVSETSLDIKKTDESIDIPVKASLTPEAYIRWIDDPSNGITVRKSIGSFKFILTFKPYEYIILKEYGNISSPEELQQKMEEINGFQYFTFRVENEESGIEPLKVGITSEEDYASRVEYCAFAMQQDIKLIDNNDTLNCELFHFERLFNIAPQVTFVLGFPKGDNVPALKSKTLLFEDRIFGTGKIYLTIEDKSLNNLPSLKIQ